MTKVILGGGLSGLSAAFYLSKFTNGQQISLIESSNRLGGWIKTNKLENNVIFEQGPRTIRPRGEAGVNTLNLVEELGLFGQIVPIYNESYVAKNRMVYANGELHLLPNSLGNLFKTVKPFSKPIISYLLQDFTAKQKIVEDESIYDFTKRRFGTEVADYLISPMICGICAGNSKEISVNFLMKTIFQYEQQYGSISKGIFKNVLHFAKKEDQPVLGRLALRSRTEKWNVYMLREGMETLPTSLQKALHHLGNVNINKNSKCTKLEFKNDGTILIHLDNGKTYNSSHIISSIPARNLASLVQSQHPDLAAMLDKIKNVTVGVVNIMYKGDLIKNPGFGFLVPPKEKLPILGVIFDSCCHQNKENTVLTVMMGGHWFKELFGDNSSEDLLFRTASDNIRHILGINETPVEYKVNILRDCIPQYVVGHEKNLRNIRSYISDRNLSLSLCGCSYDGVGINDVIISAKKAVEHIV